MMQIFRPQVHERRYMPPAGPAAPFIAIGASLLGTAVSMVGMSQQAQAQAAQANYQAQVARNNQMIMQRNADITRQQGEVAAQQRGLKTRQIMGAQKAALAAQGGDVDTGSNADIISDTAMAGKTDENTIRYNAALRAYGYENEAAGFGASAGNYGSIASNTMANMPLTLASTFLGGASSAAGKWYDMWKTA